MSKTKKIGIIICDRYRSCAGGKCFRAVRDREGAFEMYKGEEVEVVGFTSCGVCPGGNIEYAPAELKNNGAEAVHLATGFVVGYPPCPHIDHFKDFVKTKYDMDVVVGTHPIPENYCKAHEELGTWDSPEWQETIKAVITDEKTRLEYD